MTSLFLRSHQDDVLQATSAHEHRERVLLLDSLVVHELASIAGEEGALFEVAVLAAVAALLGRYSDRETVSFVAEVERRERLVRVGLAAESADSPLGSRGLIRRTSAALDEAADYEGQRCSQVLPGAGEDVTVRVVLESRSRSRTHGAGSTDFLSADLVVIVSGGTLRVAGREDRLDGDALDFIVEHLRRMIEGLACDVGAVSAITIVGDAERERILVASNALSVRFDEALPNVVEIFERHARRAPDATALVAGERRLSYRELDEASNALADRLLALGLGANARVAVYLNRGADAVIAFLGILKARGTYVPIDTGYPSGRVSAILEAAEPGIVVTVVGLLATLPPALPGLVARSVLLLEPGVLVNRSLGDGARSVATPPPARPSQRPRPRIEADDVAYTIFTSGSTGRPKGVVVDHRALANYTRAAFDAYGVGPTDRVLQAASLGFDLSLEEIVITLTAGAALVVRSAPPIESVQAFFEECVERELTVLSITSALWHELTMRLDDGSVTMPPLVRLVILGADVARPDVLTVWQRVTAGRVRLVNSYGLTETTIVATVWEATSEPLDDGWRALPVGRPLRNVSAYVLDAKSELLPIGIAGEVCIGGLAVASRYLGDEALTAARFVPDPILRGGRMYRTGDRGILRPTGEIEFLGRADYQVKVNGVRIELGEIEARLREFAGVVEGIVVAYKNAAGETELEAHVMMAGGGGRREPQASASLLRGHLARLIPLATVPSQIHVVERFPLTPAGKIDRRALVEESALRRAEAREGRAVAAPVGELEALVARTTADVLGASASSVGMLDGFVSLGGSSLSAVRAASILGHRLQRRVRAQLFLEATTLREICATLLRGSAEDRAATVEGDAVLDRSIRPAVRARGWSAAPMAQVLLTGGTGYYGTFVLADLLRATTAHITCLVRASSPEAGRARILTSLERRQCEVDPAAFAWRVTVVAGDLGRPDLGLDAATFASLSENVDTVVHVGAQVNLMLSYEALRPSNVLAVESILRFATTGRGKTVHHVSTVEVLADTDRSDPAALSERRAASSPALLQDGYGQSKWAAEKLVETARDRGVRAYIHRPGRLMGHSRTGVLNPDDFLVRMLEACARVRAAPMLDVGVDITPVDYASRALVRLAELAPDPASAEAYHLVHPDMISWKSFVVRIIELGYPLHLVAHDTWRALLERHVESKKEPETRTEADFSLYLAAMSRDELESSIHGGYASRATRAALGQGIACPPIDGRLVSTYLRRLEGDGRFPAPIRRSLRSSTAPVSHHRPRPREQI